MATTSGTVKKTALDAFSRPRANGIIALDLRGDSLVGAAITDGGRDILLFASSGKAIRFQERDVRPMGRTAAGVRGIKLESDQSVIALQIVDDGDVLTATENGFGKRTKIEEFPTKGRGGKGVIAIQTSARNGDLVGAIQVLDEDEIMLITSGGTLVRTDVDEISQQGRNTQGVTLIRLVEGDRLMGLDRIVSLAEDESEE